MLKNTLYFFFKQKITMRKVIIYRVKKTKKMKKKNLLKMYIHLLYYIYI
jgi:hypothetical protein